MRIPFLSGDDLQGTTLRKGRVYLRPPRREDWRDWARLRERSRAFLVPWEPTWSPDSLTREGYRRRLRQYREDWESRISYTFFIFDDDSNQILGGISLTNVRRGVVMAGTLGYWMGQEFSRQGYMSEGLQAVMTFAFSDLKLHRLEAACLPHNEASQRLLRKTGFREVGLARQYLLIAGKWQDHLLFEFLKSDQAI